jgi:hypothetical protein
LILNSRLGLAPAADDNIVFSGLRLEGLEDPMIEYTFDAANAILHVRPRGPLEKSDFEALTKEVDPFLEKSGKLAGLIVEIGSFPGWENVCAMSAHLRFVRDHHRRIHKVAVVTDSALSKVAETLAAHFVAAEIKRFPAAELGAARRWILEQA